MAAGADDRPGRAGGVSDLRQFTAVLRKNFLLRTSAAGRGFLGLSGSLWGWLGLALEVLLPVAFFLIMCVPSYYIQPTPLPAQFFPKGRLDSLDWVMAYYQGPGAACAHGATVLFAPNTTKEVELMTMVAQSLSCQHLKEPGPLGNSTPALHGAADSVFIQKFSDLFPLEGRPPQCSARATCLASPECYQPILGAQLIGFATEAEAVQHALAHAETVDAVLAFQGGIGTRDVAYDIRINHTLVPDTRARLNGFEIRPGYEYRKYWFFANLQQYVDRAIIGQATGAGNASAEVVFGVKPYPWPAKTINFAAFVSGGFFKLLVVLAFLPQVKSAVVSIVQEKELRLREGMKTLGLHAGAYWGSWILTHFTTLFLSGVGCAIVGTYPFPNTSVEVMLVLYALSAMALIGFSYFLSTLFASQRVAGFAAVVFFSSALLPGYLMPALVQPYGGVGWLLCCLLPPSAIILFVECILKAETMQQGVTWDTLRVSAAVEYHFSPATVLGMLLLDVVMYGVVTWYCDQVLPSEWGQRQPWYFVFLRSYWFPPEPEQSSEAQMPLLSDADEEDRQGSGVAVSIKNLSKAFRTSDGVNKLAVDCLDLDIYQGQITALLGHNGAGKTTTISILTGMLPATTGTAVVNGRRLDQDMGAIRQSLGLCPQFDILWPTITVQDHLYLYANIKGLSGGEAWEAVAAAAKDVGLEEKLLVPAGELSGGEARKLSVAIAFMGHPKVVFLDEPTSTMDPYSRRFTWDVIRRNRKSCAVILTTHSMEEADVLSDRIAIMSSGRLAAVGSSLDLKSQYGVGYTLTAHTTVQPGCQVTSSRLEELAQQHVRGASLLSHAGAEISLRLPGTCRAAFPGLLRAIEANKADLCVSSYGLAVTTLEEVFLKVTQGSQDQAPEEPPSGASSLGPDGDRTAQEQTMNSNPRSFQLPVSSSPLSSPVHHSRRPAPLTGFALYRHQLAGLLMKRHRCAMRDWGASITQLAVPLVLVAVALYARTVSVRVDSLPAKEMERYNMAFGLPAGLCISEQAESDPRGVEPFLDAYHRKHLLDSGTHALQTWFSPLPVNQTIDGWLLDNWYVSSNHTYDSLYIDTVPSQAATGSTADGTCLTLLVNETSFHALPTAINQASTALLRMVRKDEAKITVRSHPLPVLPSETSQQLEAAGGNLLLVLLLMLAMAGLSASFSVFLVREAACSSKLVQLVAGAPPSAFWLANFAYDIGVTSVALLGTVAAFVVSGLPEYQGVNLLALVALLLLFGLAALPLAYCLHFLYQDEMQALQGLNTLFTTVGTLGFLIVWILEFLDGFFHFASIARYLMIVKGLLISSSPHYCLGQAVYNIAASYNPDDFQAPQSPFSSGIAGRYMAWLAVQAAVYSTLTIAIELCCGRWMQLASWIFGTRAGTGDESQAMRDVDVAAELRQARAAVHENDPAFQLVLAGAAKSYPQGLLKPHVEALRGVWLTVQRGESLGLLGVTGAGKTTSFRVATGQVAPTAGDVHVCGHSVTKELATVRTFLGYCPQEDPLLSLLTGRELLTLFAHLRGVPREHIPGMVTHSLTHLGFEEYADRACGSYSGGNKRKLSVSVALVGQPSVVLLDEPSAGLDPGARRFLWEYMSSEVMGAGRSVMLTSHSMEECEVLCSRIAILAAGGLRCVGTPQHLKGRFAEGYSLELKVSPWDSQDHTHPTSKFMAELASHGAELLETDGAHFHFRLPSSDMDLPQLFEHIEASRGQASILDYSLSQTTLEQVFLRLAHDESPLGSDAQPGSV